MKFIAIYVVYGDDGTGEVRIKQADTIEEARREPFCERYDYGNLVLLARVLEVYESKDQMASAAHPDKEPSYWGGKKRIPNAIQIAQDESIWPKDLERFG